MKNLVGIILFWCIIIVIPAAGDKPPVRLAIIGLDHDAAGDFISRTRVRADVQLVGIVEPNQALIKSYVQLLNLSTNFFYPDLESLLAKTNVQAVAVFTTTLDHRGAVEACAPHKIDVMLEKPLAVNMDDALAMSAAAKSNGTEIVVNYETSWYSSIGTAYNIIHKQRSIGDPRKIIVIAGNQGPKDAGCSDAFLDWLTNPTLNGGGALTDFGCYGADLITWFMDGQRPESVSAVSNHFKPQLYPKVEDEATIVLTYPRSQGIVQASWNLPFSERSLQIYGISGYVFAPQMDLLRLRMAGTEESELELKTQPEPGLMTDDISYFVAVVRREIKPTGPSSLQANLVTTEILDAARKSIEQGKQIDLPRSPSW
jgi:predicted dehydrogenase